MKEHEFIKQVDKEFSAKIDKSRRKQIWAHRMKGGVCVFEMTDNKIVDYEILQREFGSFWKPREWMFPSIDFKTTYRNLNKDNAN